MLAPSGHFSDMAEADFPIPLAETRIGDTRVVVIVADITTLAFDAIVNAANTSLLGGGGVDGATHSKAGPGLLAECRELRGCNVGQAKITGGHCLPARHVIHTVGPVWRGGAHGEEALLRACYRNCIALSRAKGLCSLAFPAISTGAYGYPIQGAAQACVAELCACLPGGSLTEVVLCAFTEASAQPWVQAITALNRPC